MMRTRAVSTLLALALAATLAPTAAQQRAGMSSGVKQDIIAQLTDAEQKLVQLAEATAQDKFSWRPGEGVRSIGEVFTHVAGGNYLISSFIGAKPPGDMPEDMEKTVTEKAKVIEALKASFAHARNAINGIPNAQMDQQVKMFGTTWSKRGVALLLATHAHEHLGQSIAYARSNGMVPPWSRSGGN